MVNKPYLNCFSNGIISARDEWVHDFDLNELEKKVQLFVSTYESEVKRWHDSGGSHSVNDFVNRTIKWTSELEAHLKRKSGLSFDPSKIVTTLYRPFSKMNVYYDKIVIHRLYQQPSIFPMGSRAKTPVIAFVHGGRLEFCALALDALPNYALFSLDPAQCLPLYRYDPSGNRLDNITNWGLQQFREHYGEVALPAAKIPPSPPC